MNADQKLAVCKILNVLFALTLETNQNERAREDLFSAAELLGINNLDLLTAMQG